MPVHPLRLRAPFAALRDVALYQIVHDGHELRARIVPAPRAGSDLAERVERALRAVLADCGVDVPLKVETVVEIEREGHAAKRKHVKRTA